MRDDGLDGDAANTSRTARDDTFDAWKRSRRTADVPADFADRVIAQTYRTPRTPPASARRQRVLQVAAIVLAVVATGARIAATFAVFVTR